MRLRVLGCSGAERPGHFSSAFLLDDSILLDAGTVGTALTEEEQWRIRHIFVTHAHLDHIKGIPLLADNVIISGLKHEVVVHGIPEVLRALREHLMNNVIWPDFSVIPSPNAPVIRYQEVTPGEDVAVEGYLFRATRVNHSVPAVAYTVQKGARRITYTGDTGPTFELWAQPGRLDALIVEVSFPNHLEELALLTGHLTTRLLEAELKKMPLLPKRILITHPKPQYHETIRAELKGLCLSQLELLQEGSVYDF